MFHETEKCISGDGKIQFTKLHNDFHELHKKCGKLKLLCAVSYTHLQCFGMSPFGAALLGINGFLTFLVCVPTRILMGWLTGLIYKGLRKTKLPSGASVTISNRCV